MNHKIRVAHRWLSAIFMLFVFANFAVMPLGNEALGMAVGGATLLPLSLVMLTGSYLFVLPWLPKKSRSEAEEA